MAPKPNSRRTHHSSPIQCLCIRTGAMIRTLTLSLASALLLTAGTPALARGDRDRDQENLREAAAQGKVIPLGRLIAEVRSHPPYSDMTYLGGPRFIRSEEHTSELQSLMRISYAVFCLNKKTYTTNPHITRPVLHHHHVTYS